MEASRCAEALLRSSRPILAAYRSAQTQRATSCIVQQCITQRDQCLAARTFTTHTSHRQPAQPAEQPSPSSPGHPSTSPSSSSSDSTIDAILNLSLDQSKGTPTAPASRTSHFKSPNAQASNPPSRGLRRQFDSVRDPAEPNSVDDIVDQLRGGRFSKWSNSGGPNPEGHMRDLNPFGDLQLSRNSPAPPPFVESAPMRLGPTVGRTVKVNEKQGMDVARAFRSVEMLCARNGVRRDHMKQRFHERPGLRRKRLKSERWRKNFKENFQSVVATALRLKRQGW